MLKKLIWHLNLVCN